MRREDQATVTSLNHKIEDMDAAMGIKERDVTVLNARIHTLERQLEEAQVEAEELTDKCAASSTEVDRRGAISHDLSLQVFLISLIAPTWFIMIHYTANTLKLIVHSLFIYTSFTHDLSSSLPLASRLSSLQLEQSTSLATSHEKRVDEISESLKEATVKGRQLEGQLTEAGENERALLRQIEDLEGGGATLDRRLKEVRTV